ncbi:MAG TPA: TauD/TfdA family dioxygenase, partial [Burkholderiales bacterium]|nr:TauD/TfdA family dioxygenase [Burkholderiales bacterium]
MEILPINGFIGAEIRGVDLSRLDDATFKEIHDALVKYEVIVLRDQKALTLEGQMAFGARFGPLVIHPFSPNLPDKPEVIVLDYSEDNPANRTDVWHADETYRENPPMATMLRGRVIPARGGDTCFSSMTAAYRGLSERMKVHIHGLEALHDFKPFRSLFNNTPAHRRRLREIEDEFPNPWHPVVRVHPVSGRRAIYVNPQFTVRIRDLKEDESQALLSFLYAQASVPEYQLRVKWQPDTVVMWDNRSVQHYAPHDYYPQRRTMERVTISGDKPVGVTGSYTPETVEGLGLVNPKGTPKKA